MRFMDLGLRPAGRRSPDRRPTSPVTRGAYVSQVDLRDQEMAALMQVSANCAGIAGQPLMGLMGAVCLTHLPSTLS